ncbi:MAG: elongation factor P [Acidobacteriota bacterium]|nr:elongation factor P [Acidobacteriota bacterium]
MISTNDFKKGVRYELEGAPWQVMEVSVHNPSARGAATLVKAKSRNLKTGQVLLKTFKAGEMLNEPDLNRMTVQYLYDEGEDLVFMDKDTYEQYNVRAELIGDARPWLNEEIELMLLQYNGEVINAELPQSVIATVSTVEAGAKGDTASGKVLAKAVLDNGVTIAVPTFIKEGQKIKVDPGTNSYLGRE